MATTKRTTANYAVDIYGQKVRLLATRLTSNQGLNNLDYSTVRDAVSDGRDFVCVQTKYSRTDQVYYVLRAFGSLKECDIDAYLLGLGNRAELKSGPVYRIGCHVFTLAQFNRILRAAGVDTNKTKTAKIFAARA